MNRILTLLTFTLLFSSCVHAQIANITSNDTATLEQVRPALAANISIGSESNDILFDRYEVIMGKAQNCLTVYDLSTNEPVYSGDGETFMLDTCTMVCMGTDAYAKVNIYTGEGLVTIDSTTTICNKPQPTVLSQR